MTPTSVTNLDAALLLRLFKVTCQIDRNKFQENKKGMKIRKGLKDINGPYVKIAEGESLR